MANHESVVIESETSAWRGGWFFLALTFRRQARARLFIWVSLGLLMLVALLTHLNTRFNRWNMGHWRMPRNGPTVSQQLHALNAAAGIPAVGSMAGPAAVVSALRAAAFEGVGTRIFAGAILFGMLGSFLLPLWTLTFASESLGGYRESRTLSWILLRPIPRPGIYLAGYLAGLPWCLLLVMGGYVVFCWLAGAAGQAALPVFWPPLLVGTLAFAAFFQFLAVTFRRASILGLLYAFFFETIAGNLPGQQKRLSISYYVRCWMLERAEDADLILNLGGTRPPVSGATAVVVLLGATVVLLIAGMVVFSRKEYIDIG